MDQRVLANDRPQVAWRRKNAPCIFSAKNKNSDQENPPWVLFCWRFTPGRFKKTDCKVSMSYTNIHMYMYILYVFNRQILRLEMYLFQKVIDKRRGEKYTPYSSCRRWCSIDLLQTPPGESYHLDPKWWFLEHVFLFPTRSLGRCSKWGGSTIT